MRRDLKRRALEPVGPCETQNHHPAKRTKPQQVEVGEIPDEPHGRSMDRGERIAYQIEFIALSFNFNYL